MYCSLFQTSVGKGKLLIPYELTAGGRTDHNVSLSYLPGWPWVNSPSLSIPACGLPMALDHTARSTQVAALLCLCGNNAASTTAMVSGRFVSLSFPFCKETK